MQQLEHDTHASSRGEPSLTTKTPSSNNKFTRGEFLGIIGASVTTLIIGGDGIRRITSLDELSTKQNRELDKTAEALRSQSYSSPVMEDYNDRTLKKQEQDNNLDLTEQKALGLLEIAVPTVFGAGILAGIVNRLRRIR